MNDADAGRAQALRALGRYFPRGADRVAALPLARAHWPDREALPPALVEVALPRWAAAWGPSILVPAAALVAGADEAWRRTDWPGAAAWYLEARAEREHERLHGPIHSYSARLRGWDSRQWERAWVNRIALFLRRWAAHEADADEVEVCGPLPAAEIVLTHDVDATRKTFSLRAKQGAFCAVNAVRGALAGRGDVAARQARGCMRFLFGPDGISGVAEMARLEAQAGVRSVIHVHGGVLPPHRRPWRQRLLDPAYEVSASGLAPVLRDLAARGWRIGVHPSFDAWADAEPIAREREHLERVLGVTVDACRQHWLRFGWERTWAAQRAAGVALDSTLGFNDRPGFRIGAALRFEAPGAAAGLEVLPLVLMDSQLYDYELLDEEGRLARMRGWLDEVRAVRGQASVLWHSHVLGDDYGWRPGFEALLAALAPEAG